MNIGVFIDADNISAATAETALNQLAKIGEIRFAKAYGNWGKKPPVWKALVNSYGVETIHRYNVSRTKNAADISLTVEATASFYGKLSYDAIAIVSSDSDFIPLIQHAQACGKHTIGLGFRKAPVSYSRQCHQFIYLDDPAVIEMNAVNH